ncbi:MULTISPECIES: hypothetical protein [Acidobacterium]|uniref:hypothetical protein n=1 Tax=Acidobacterium TaxID=33973 RepID=UPI0011D07B2A|nr:MULTISPECIES: hypothetical protein [Acidobacterium]
MRIVKSPAGAGSGEQWVRTQFPKEVSACRNRHAETKLIVLVDADTHSVPARLQQLGHALDEAQVQRIERNEEIACLVPRRNIETWILCLNDEQVDENTDYKGRHADWSQLIRTGSTSLYRCTRPNAAIPPHYVPSLHAAISELQRMNFKP